MTDIEHIRVLCQGIIDEAAHTTDEVGEAGAQIERIRAKVCREVVDLIDARPLLISPERIPALQRASLENYAAHGLHPGQFLRAVLEGDLFAAMSRGDDACLLALPAIVTYVRCSMPSGSWGSPEAVSRWIALVRA